MESRLCSDDCVSPGQGQVGDCSIRMCGEAHSYIKASTTFFWCCAGTYVCIHSHTQLTKYMEQLLQTSGGVYIPMQVQTLSGGNRSSLNDCTLHYVKSGYISHFLARIIYYLSL